MSDYNANLAAAVKRVSAMDAIDKAAGFAAPRSLPPKARLLTIREALRAGVQISGTNDECIFDGMAMIEQWLAEMEA